MLDVAIRAEDLSKKYLVGHQSRREKYMALRDVLAREAHNFARKTVDMIRGRQIVQGDEVEEFWALKDINFEVKRGEVIGVIGRNGAGKSTLLKILSRVTEPTIGRVRLNGRVASLLEVGTGFHPELTGRENIYLNGAILGMTRAEIRRKFDEIVAFAEVEDFLDTPVKHYSSGMYVRLAFAVAAHLEPEILAIDEVLAVGDAAFQKKCLGKIGDVARAGRTVLFVSHNMNAIERLCGRVLWLDGGRLVDLNTDVRKGISAYLKGIVAEATGSLWTGTDAGKEYGNEYFSATRLEVRSQRPVAAPDEPFQNSFPIEILIDGQIGRPDPAMCVGIAVYNESDQLLFWSFTTDQSEQLWPKMEQGPLHLRVILPAHLLNEGVYRVELVSSLHYRGWIITPRADAPTVKFIIRGGLSNSPHWYTGRGGVLAPVLLWECQRANSA